MCVCVLLGIYSLQLPPNNNCKEVPTAAADPFHRANPFCRSCRLQGFLREPHSLLHFCEGHGHVVVLGTDADHAAEQGGAVVWVPLHQPARAVQEGTVGSGEIQYFTRISWAFCRGWELRTATWGNCDRYFWFEVVWQVWSDSFLGGKWWSVMVKLLVYLSIVVGMFSLRQVGFLSYVCIFSTLWRTKEGLKTAKAENMWQLWTFFHSWIASRHMCSFHIQFQIFQSMSFSSATDNNG